MIDSANFRECLVRSNRSWEESPNDGRGSGAGGIEFPHRYFGRGCSIYIGASRVAKNRSSSHEFYEPIARNLRLPFVISIERRRPDMYETRRCLQRATIENMLVKTVYLISFFLNRDNTTVYDWNALQL